MKPARFDYVRPKSLDEAVAALSKPGAVAIAGGQSLLPMLSLRVAPADLLVDIGRLQALKTPDEPAPAGMVRIGAGITHAEIEDGIVPDPSSGLMRKVAAGISYRAVRNHGTIGGSVALADPAADWPVCLIALGAVANVLGPDGVGGGAMANFVRGAYTTGLQPGEIITSFDLPKFDVAPRYGYAKVVRKSGAFAQAIGCVVTWPGVRTQAVLGGTTGAPLLLPRFAEALDKSSPAEDHLRAAIATDLDTVAPDADAYQRRLYTATLLRSAREAKA